MAYNYGNITVKGITYQGKGSSSNPAISYWTAPTSFAVYAGANATSADHTESAGQTLWLHYYYTNSDGTLSLNPYFLGVVSGGGRWFARETAFPTGQNIVTYNAAGGTGTPANQNLAYGSTVTAGAAPTWVGHIFGGWKSSKSSTVYAAGATIPSTEYTDYLWNATNPTLTMTAQWTLQTYTVAYNANGGSGSVSSQTKTYGTPLTLASSGFTRSLYTLSGWNTASDGGGTAYALGGTYEEEGPATMYAVWAPIAPTAPASITNTRDSDTRNTVTWTNPSAVITTTQVLRSVDGGAYSAVATISGATTSYVDTATAANHSYAYKVSVSNASGTATSAASSTTYNTPAAPTAVSAVRLDASTVGLTITNPAITATALEIQRSTDGSTWSTIATVSGIVTSATDSPSGGTFYYRARNTRGTLVSAWSAASQAVVTVTPPNAPTLVSPASGAAVSTSTASIVFTWQHNPIDGSSQTNAQLQYSTNGGSTWTTATVTTAQTYSLANNFSANDVITWRVRTKGADPSYGPYSSSRSFTVYQTPTVTWTSPVSGGTITNMPIGISLSYSDVAPSTLANATVTISQGGATLYTMNLGTATSGTITADEFFPNNGQSYTFTATARSTSSLQATSAIVVSVAFTEPDTASLALTNNPETGAVQLQATVDSGTGGAPAESISIYRVSRNGRVLLASGLSDGAAIEDLYAPLNTEYTYECVTFSAAGAAGTTVWSNTLSTNKMFFLWEGRKAAYGYRNPEGTVTISRPEKVRVHYVGKTYPNSYDGSAIDDTRTVSALIDTPEMAYRFTAMMEAGGTCVYKSLTGDVFWADAMVTAREILRRPDRYGTVSISLFRIQGPVL